MERREERERERHGCCHLKHQGAAVDVAPRAGEVRIGEHCGGAGGHVQRAAADGVVRIDVKDVRRVAAADCREERGPWRRVRQ